MKAQRLPSKNSGKNSGKRGGHPHPPFEPGHAPLPGGGRPKGMKNWATVAREEFEAGKITQAQIMRALLKRGKQGNTKAIEILMDRTDGKPLQPVRMEGELKTIAEADEAALNGELQRVRDKLAEIARGNTSSKA